MPKPRKKKPEPEKRPPGRPSAFKESFIGEARRLTLLGATDAELATCFGVTVTTIGNWKHAHPEFLAALKDGKQEADCTIAASLYERAKGYEYIKQIPFKVKKVVYDAGKRLSETEEVITVDVLEKVPPETTAMIFWLKNRRHVEWRDRRDVDVTTNGQSLLPSVERDRRVAELLGVSDGAEP
jgi:hypothetical protein